jgi:hypothetical protein
VGLKSHLIQLNPALDFTGSINMMKMDFLLKSFFFGEPSFLFCPNEQFMNRWKIISQNNKPWNAKHPSLKNGDESTNKSNDNE